MADTRSGSHTFGVGQQDGDVTCIAAKLHCSVLPFKVETALVACGSSPFGHVLHRNAVTWLRVFSLQDKCFPPTHTYICGHLRGCLCGIIGHYWVVLGFCHAGRKTTEVVFWKIVWISGRPFGDVRVGFGRSRRRGWIHGGHRGVRPGIAPRGVWVIWKPFWRFGITTRAREIGVQYLQTDVRKKDPQCHPKKLPERGGSVGGSPARGPGAPTSSFVVIFLFYSCSSFANWSGARGGAHRCRAQR